ncbi:hypothetical protein WK91_34555 [Burkholderia cepacia]|nr:hypothetical protein WK91_34555 [Burkholderia cepacia]
MATLFLESVGRGDMPEYLFGFVDDNHIILKEVRFQQLAHAVYANRITVCGAIVLLLPVSGMQIAGQAELSGHTMQQRLPMADQKHGKSVRQTLTADVLKSFSLAGTLRAADERYAGVKRDCRKELIVHEHVRSPIKQALPVSDFLGRRLDQIILIAVDVAEIIVAVWEIFVREFTHRVCDAIEVVRRLLRLNRFVMPERGRAGAAKDSALSMSVYDHHRACVAIQMYGAMNRGARVEAFQCGAASFGQPHTLILLEKNLGAVTHRGSLRPHFGVAIRIAHTNLAPHNQELVEFRAGQNVAEDDRIATRAAKKQAARIFARAVASKEANDALICSPHVLRVVDRPIQLEDDSETMLFRGVRRCRVDDGSELPNVLILQRDIEKQSAIDVNGEDIGASEVLPFSGALVLSAERMPIIDERS